MKITYIVLAAALAYSSLSVGQIGGDTSTIDALVAQPGVQRLSIVNKSKYNIHTVQLPSHRLQYYVGKDNKIFCESWSGLSHPDLSEALGSYYPEYKAALQSTRRKGQRHHVVSTSSIYVERFGQMRNIKGRACILSYKPSDVTLDEIK